MTQDYNGQATCKWMCCINISKSDHNSKVEVCICVMAWLPVITCYSCCSLLTHACGTRQYVHVKESGKGNSTGRLLVLFLCMFTSASI